MSLKLIIIIIAVIILLVGICSGPSGNPAPDRKKTKVNHLLTSAHDLRYNDTHTMRGRELKKQRDAKNKKYR